MVMIMMIMIMIHDHHVWGDVTESEGGVGKAEVNVCVEERERSREMCGLVRSEEYCARTGSFSARLRLAWLETGSSKNF